MSQKLNWHQIECAPPRHTHTGILSMSCTSRHNLSPVPCSPCCIGLSALLPAVLVFGRAPQARGAEHAELLPSRGLRMPPCNGALQLWQAGRWSTPVSTKAPAAASKRSVRGVYIDFASSCCRAETSYIGGYRFVCIRLNNATGIVADTTTRPHAAVDTVCAPHLTCLHPWWYLPAAARANWLYEPGLPTAVLALDPE